MKRFFMDFDYNSNSPLYIQLYNKLKEDINTGRISPGEKLPSLRKIAKDLDVSVTTSEQAYNQLLVEGYLVSKPKSGFYVAESLISALPKKKNPGTPLNFRDYTFPDSPYLYDTSAFDFQRWKKAMNRVYNEYSHMLLFESDVQGEQVLRYEISRYLYSSRGVVATPDQIVIGAGTQQLTGFLAVMLKKMNIDYVCTEDPGYTLIQNIFRDYNFAIGKIPVTNQGLDITKLPVNIPSAVYVSPSNQFPTGTVMPAGNRYRLLDWAKKNNSIILEDDYDSELRYFGNPIPSLQGMDPDAQVVYLGSFSSTLFPAIKISYMVLPESMISIFDEIKGDYTQGCSKTEQLTLAFYMEEGNYYRNIKKLRSLYANKLHKTIETFEKQGEEFITPFDTKSGIRLIVSVKSHKSSLQLCEEAKQYGIKADPVNLEDEENRRFLSIYYSYIPINEIPSVFNELICCWAE